MMMELIGLTLWGLVAALWVLHVTPPTPEPEPAEVE